MLMRRRPIVYSLLLSLAFLVSTLSVCNAHLSATEHSDCARCLVTSTSRREDGAPAHLPVRAHHCPNHACAHLHALFIVDSGLVLTPPAASWFFPPSSQAHGQESLHVLLRPPRT